MYTNLLLVGIRFSFDTYIITAMVIGPRCNYRVNADRVPIRLA